MHWLRQIILATNVNSGTDVALNVNFTTPNYHNTIHDVILLLLLLLREKKIRARRRTTREESKAAASIIVSLYVNNIRCYHY